MKAMVFSELCGLEVNQSPLELLELPDPIPSANEILIRVSACAVCHTELDEIKGRTHPPRLPIILGHQVVGRIEATGSEANTFRMEIVSVSPGFSLSVEHARSVWQAMKIYVRNSKLTVDM